MSKEWKYTAFDSIVRRLAMRDHTEKELKIKLKTRFSPSEIEEAIQKAKDIGYLKHKTEDLVKISKNLSEQLLRKGKGRLKIQNELKKRGLPPVEVEEENEYEKILALLEKFLDNPRLARDKTQYADQKALQMKMYRHLIQKGFAPSLARKAIYEKLKSSR